MKLVVGVLGFLSVFDPSMAMQEMPTGAAVLQPSMAGAGGSVFSKAVGQAEEAVGQPFRNTALLDEITPSCASMNQADTHLFAAGAVNSVHPFPI